jgi:hypothetical protein
MSKSENGWIDGRVNRTGWARKARGESYDCFVGVRLGAADSARLDRVCKLLNIGRSDMVRSLIRGLREIPLCSEDFGKKDSPTKVL